MTKIVVEIPDELEDELARYGDRSSEIFLLGLSQLKIHESLLLYQRGVVSFARAAELASISRTELIRHAHAAGIEPRWSEDMLSDEVA